MTNLKLNADRPVEIDELLDFAYSADARRAAERERNRAVGTLLNAPESRRERKAAETKRAA